MPRARPVRRLRLFQPGGKRYEGSLFVLTSLRTSNKIYDWTRANAALDECLVDDHLGGDVRQFASLLRFDLLPHRLEVALHSVNAN